MAQYDYDLFTIGAGSGGVRASRMSAAFGAKVGIAEERYLGGTCVNVGCIPKKLLVYAAHYGEDFSDMNGFGWTIGERRFDWAALIENKNREIQRLNSVYRKLLDAAGVELFEDHAVVVEIPWLEAYFSIRVRGRFIPREEARWSLRLCTRPRAAPSASWSGTYQ